MAVDQCGEMETKQVRQQQNGNPKEVDLKKDPGKYRLTYWKKVEIVQKINEC